MATPRKQQPKVKWATYTQVQTAAAGWADAVLQCRTLGHSWAQSNAVHVRRLRYWQVTYACTRECGVIKYQEWSERGVPFASWMIYPKDEDGNELYLAEGIGRVAGETKGALRIESVMRAGFDERTGRASDEDIPRSSRTRLVVGNGRNGRAPAKST